MKFLSLNCNGFRAAVSKGFEEWFLSKDYDVLALQEIKAHLKDLNFENFEKAGYIPFIFPAQKKGYSGTAIFTKLKPQNTSMGLGNEFFDSEGRCIQLEFKEFTFLNCYFPSGTSGDERQTIKMKFLDFIYEYLNKLKRTKKDIIVCGDVNIAHTEIDIHDPKGNEKNSGFLPEERDWLTKFLNSGWCDTFRVVHPYKKDAYSWWTYRFNARSKNKGWRIDYFFVSQNLKEKVKDSGILSELVFSDHAPIFLEIDL
ncbi:MAG: exodeoxyribonuclease III [Leptospiraceae bacterium]|nr:exodeoxyribonuclease III [Leptospiraceae bacterium]